MDRLGEELGGERGVLGGLEDDGAARGEGRGRLGDDLVERVVPGGDRADDAHGLQQDGGVAQLLLEGGGGGGQFGVGARHEHGQAGVHRPGERQRGAELGGDGLGDLFRAGRQHVAQGRDAGRALGGRGGRPAREGGPGGAYRGVDVLGGPGRDVADDLFVRRVDDRDGVLAEGRHPLPADVHAVVCLHGVPPGFAVPAAAASPYGRVPSRRTKLALLVFRRQGTAGDAGHVPRPGSRPAPAGRRNRSRASGALPVPVGRSGRRAGQSRAWAR